MKDSTFRRTLVGAAVALALGVVADPAPAAPYKGAFDPTDFRGEYIINVNPACLTQGNGWFANTGICSATLLSAFSHVDSSSPEPTFYGNLNFAPPAISSNSQLFGLYVYGGKIDSFDTAPLPFVPGSSDPTTDSWWLQFVSGQMTDCYAYCPASPLDVSPDAFDNTLRGVYLSDQNGIIAMAQYLGPAVDLAVPEPATVGLVLGGLGAGWLSRRRKKERDPPPD